VEPKSTFERYLWWELSRLTHDTETPLACVQVDNFYCVLIFAKCCGEQAHAFDIYAEVVHPPMDTGHGNGLNEPKRGALLRGRWNGEYSKPTKADRVERFYSRHGVLRYSGTA